MKMKRITIRLSATEWGLVEKFCRQNKISISSFMRQIINHYPTDKIHVVNDDEVDAINKVINELRKVGNNLNQIAHYYNLEELKKHCGVRQEQINLVLETINDIKALSTDIKTTLNNMRNA